jgi:PmbA protein
MVEDLLAKAKWGRKIASVASGKYPVIFVPESAAALVDYILTAASGRFVNEKSSKFVRKLGEKLFDSRISVIDDPTVDWGVASFCFDDEGVPGHKKYLIKNGKVATFYYDLKQAAAAGVASSGNGERGPFTQANPALSNINILGGKESYAKLLKSIKKGLVVYNLLGVGQNNPFNGDFQLGVNLGYAVENGEITGRIKNVALAGNVFDILKNSLMWLSSEVETWGSFTSPYFCVDNVVVTAK